jgi:hypothetical protein
LRDEYDLRVDLLPSRRGWVHYTVLSLGLVFALLCAAISVWLCSQGLETRSAARNQVSKIATTGPPTRFPEVKAFLDNAIDIERRSLHHARELADGFPWLFFWLGLLTLADALTTPGKSKLPRYSELRRRPDPRRSAWVDTALVAACLLLFKAEAALLDNLLKRPPPQIVVPSNGERARALVLAELTKMDRESYLPLATAALGLLVFTFLTWRLVRRLWKGVRDERKRRQGEVDVQALEQF